MHYIRYSISCREWRTFDYVKYKRFFCSPNRADCCWAQPTLSAGAEVNQMKHQPECSIFWSRFEMDCSLIKEELPPS